MNFEIAQKKNVFSISILTALILTVSCEKKVVKTSSSSIGMSSEVLNIFEAKCVSCHSGASAPGGFNFATNTDAMIAAGLITPGDPEESVLYQKLTASPPYGERMPKGGPFLSADEMAYISEWVTNANVTPTVEITTPLASSIVDSSANSATYVVSGSCNIANATITIKLDGTAVGTSTTCTNQSFSTTIDTTGITSGSHTLSASMVRAVAGVNVDSASIGITKDLTALSIAITSHLNSSTADRTATGTDSSLITSNSTAMVVSGSCNVSGRPVTVAVDGATAGTSTCDGTSFSTSVDTNSWTNAAVSPSVVSGAHKLVATISNPGGSSASSSVYVFKSTSPTMLFSTQIKSLFYSSDFRK